MVNASRDGDTVLQENLLLGAPATEKSRGKKKKNRLAEFDEFSRQWEISDGFDVCDPPFDLIEGPCIFEDINSLSSDNEYVKLAYDCVNFAINYENEHKVQNLSLKLVELVKFNLDSEPGGNMYYLTFKAKDRDDREDVYQAKVFMPEEKEEEEEVDVVEKYKAYIAQFGKSENGFADHTDLEGEEEEEEDVEEDEKDDYEEDEKEVEEEDVEDEKDGEDDEEDDEGDEKDYEGTQEMKVLIFRKKQRC